MCCNIIIPIYISSLGLEMNDGEKTGEARKGTAGLELAYCCVVYCCVVEYYSIKLFCIINYIN